MNFRNKKIFHILLYLALLNYINSKNIILPLKKILMEISWKNIQ